MFSDWINLVSSVITAGSNVASSLIQANTAKDIAEIQAKTQLAIQHGNQAQAQLYQKVLENLIAQTTLNTSGAIRLSADTPPFNSPEAVQIIPKESEKEYINLPVIGVVEKQKAYLYGIGLLALIYFLKEK